METITTIIALIVVLGMIFCAVALVTFLTIAAIYLAFGILAVAGVIAFWLAYGILIGVGWILTGVGELAYGTLMGSYIVLDTLIINPIVNWMDKDLYFLRKTEHISLFNCLCMRDDEKEAIKCKLENESLKELILNKEISYKEFHQLKFYGNDYFALQEVNIKKLFKKNMLSFEQLQKMNHYIRHAFSLDVICNLFEKETLTLQQLEQMTALTHDALKLDNIVQLLQENVLNFDQLLKISQNAYDALQLDSIVGLFEKDMLSFEQLQKMNHDIRDAFSLEVIHNLYEKKTITYEQLQEITAFTHNPLKLDNFVYLLEKSKITFDQLLKVNQNAYDALQLDFIVELFEKSLLNFSQLQMIIPSASSALSHKHIFTLFKNKRLTLHELLKINVNAVESLQAEHISNLLFKNTITIENLNGLKNQKEITLIQEALKTESILSLITNKKLTFDQFKVLNLTALKTLVDNPSEFNRITDQDMMILKKLDIHHIAKLYGDNRLSIQQLRDLTPEIQNLLFQRHISEHYESGVLTFDHLKESNLQDLLALKNEHICQLFKDHKLTIHDVKECSNDPFLQDVLSIDIIWMLLSYNKSTFEDIRKIKHLNTTYTSRKINANFIESLITLNLIYIERLRSLNSNQKVDLLEAIPHSLNEIIESHNETIRSHIFDTDIQSTHTDSTESTFSKFVMTLMKDYTPYSNIDSYIEQLYGLLQQNSHLSKKSWKKELYIFDTLIHSTWQHGKTNCTFKQLLFLTYCSMRRNNVDSKLYVSALYEALYEIRRGNNIDSNGIDDEQQDKTICPEGMFNKIIEKMVGLLPNCEFKHVNGETISFKIIATIKQAIKDFIASEHGIQILSKENKMAFVFKCIDEEVKGVLSEYYDDKDAKDAHELFELCYQEFMEREDIETLLDDQVKQLAEKYPDKIPRNTSGGFFDTRNYNAEGIMRALRK